MRFLLTSAGIKNTSIHDALVDLLGKPIAESSALCIPTAAYGHPMAGPGAAWRFISGREARTPMCELGWKSLGVLELTALPSIDQELWVPMVRETDVLLVNGGDPLYLCYWMRQSGLADLLPSLRETVFVGLSAGSMVMAPNIGEDFVRWTPPTGGDETLGMVGFSIFPHLDHEDLPDNSMAHAERWAAGMPVPAYAIDDQTAIKVTDGTVDVVSEGHWKLFAPDLKRLGGFARDIWLWWPAPSGRVFCGRDSGSVRAHNLECSRPEIVSRPDHLQPANRKPVKRIREAVSDLGRAVRCIGERPPTGAAQTTGDEPRCST